MTTQEIGELMKARREYLGLTQGAVALKLGIPRSTYAQLEGGYNEIKASDLYNIARVLHVPVGYLYGEMDEQGLADLELMKLFIQLPQWAKGVTRGLVRNLFDQCEAMK